MEEIFISVATYTVKYFMVLVAGLAAGYLNSVIIHILLDRILLEKKSLLECWRDFRDKKRKGEAGEIREIIVVFSTAAVFILVFSKYGLTADFAFFAYLMCILIIMFFIDIKTKTIPNGLVLAGLAGSAAAFVYNIFLPLKIYEDGRWWSPLLGILPGSGLLLLTALFGAIVFKNEEVMGMGDVKIFAPVGIFLGWKMCALVLVLSMFLGGLASIILIILSIKKRKDTIPFGPFIAIAAFIAIMWGQDIWFWYFSFL
ncbi:MAG: prepilin peptidase [Clostridiaceae bacterium]|nr:prepilin peptidase [Clostridiaceae bacterium]